MAALLSLLLTVAAAGEGRVGVLVVAHGREAGWNREVLAASAPLRRTAPVEVAFGRAAADSIQGALERLEAAGADRIAVVPLFLSAESFGDRIERVLGLLPKAPEPPVHGADIRGHMAYWRVLSRARLGLARSGLLESELAGEILADRARELSVRPRKEAVLVVSHGAADPVTDWGWLAHSNRLAERIRQDRPYQEVGVETLREDRLETRAQAEDMLRQRVDAWQRRGLDVIVVPLRLFDPGPVATVLVGRKVKFNGRGMLPHPKVTLWLKERARAVCAEEGWPSPF